MTVFLLQDPCLTVRHVGLVSPPVTEPLILETRHPPVLVRFQVRIPAGITSPSELCQQINQGLSAVLPKAPPLLNWDPATQTLALPLQEDQSLLLDQESLFNWFLSPTRPPGETESKEPSGLVPGPSRRWDEEETELWDTPTPESWNPDGGTAHQLRVTWSPVGRFYRSNAFTQFEAVTHHLGLCLPGGWSLESIDMSDLPFNPFHREDPVNQSFSERLAAQLADLLAVPPLMLNHWGLSFPTIIVKPGHRICWTESELRPKKVEAALRLSPFWRRYFLPDSMTGSSALDPVPLSQLEKFRPHHRPGEKDSTIVTVSPFPNPGQSFFPSPISLCTNLIGDTLFQPTWSFPCVALIEPRGQQFDLVHQPIIRLESIESLGNCSYLVLHDGNGVRIPCGLKSRVFLEIYDF